MLRSFRFFSFPIAIVWALFVALTSQVALAQSTLTLDDFNLDDEKVKPSSNSSTSVTSGVAAPSAMEACLSDAANCSDSNLKNSTDFSIDDVVNLGIIDREEVNPSKVSTSSGTQTAVPQPLPSIDMEILFDYDSDTIRPDQYSKLSQLSQVLQGSKFDQYKFAFLGHSDAKGGRSYNQDLSFRRAQAVSRFIVDISNVANHRVVARGMGSQMLKTPYDAFGSANRRVQLVLIPVK